MTTAAQQPDRYNTRLAEQTWQKNWADKNVFATKDDSTKPPYYVLEMFPYPSGRLHMGHVRNYTIGDVICRFKRATGHNVLHPMGWDAFGLPAENAALERGAHPKEWTYSNIAAMKEQFQTLGLSFDWAREFATCDEDYYTQQQKIFLAFHKHGIAYQRDAEVNWDPIDNCVLANEEVVDGKGWRSGAPVERRKLVQWFFNITRYGNDLIDGLSTLTEWPEKVLLMQENWIGKSTGLRFHFPLAQSVAGLDKIEVYTTRPDTIFGASFVGLSPDHPIVAELAQNNAALQAFVAQCKQTGTATAELEKAEKLGFDLGLRVPHPFVAGLELPVFAANFILMSYGTGAIYGCPAHDQRDLDFAHKYNLPVLVVVAPSDQPDLQVDTEAYLDDGVLVNSDFLNGLDVPTAKQKVTEAFEAKKLGTPETQFKLRDWGVSRQRYWGCPIPMIHCASCGVVPVPEDQLPVRLPEDVTFDKPGNPLERHPTWKNVACPNCAKAAVRETDTMATFVDSSWYFARFADAKNQAQPFEAAKANHWLPVDQYIGGIEHAVLHLLYARFFTRAMKDCGMIDVAEPFKRLFTQGMLTHQTFQNAEGKWLFPTEVQKGDNGQWVETTNGQPVKAGAVIKMSKSKKNVVDPAEIVESYGADAARLFVMSDSPPEKDFEWTTAGIDGAWRFVNKIHRQVQEALAHIPAQGTIMPADISAQGLATRKKLHQMILEYTTDLSSFSFNRAVARLREFNNIYIAFKPQNQSDWAVVRECLERQVQLLNPLMPHVTEELWVQLGFDTWLVNTDWPVADAVLAKPDNVTIAVQINGKLRHTLDLAADLDSDALQQAALNDDKIKGYLVGQTVRKVIAVPNRLINIVAG